MMIELKTQSVHDRFMEYCGHALRGGFVFDKDNQMVNNVVQAFSEKRLGIMLMGNPGAGKTIVMDVLQRITHPKDPHFFIKKNTLDVVSEFNANGWEIFRKHQKQNVFFDDLGTEVKGNHYRETIEVMEKFLQFRYESFRAFGTLTHISTNLTNQQLLDRYSLRVKSRLTEMCDAFIIGGSRDATDRRTYRNYLGMPAVKHAAEFSEDDIAWRKMYEAYKLNPPTPTTKPMGMGARLRAHMGLDKKPNERTT